MKARMVPTVSEAATGRNPPNDPAKLIIKSTVLHDAPASRLAVERLMESLEESTNEYELTKGVRPERGALFNLIQEKVNFAVEKSRAGIRNNDQERMGHKYNTAHLFVYKAADLHKNKLKSC